MNRFFPGYLNSWTTKRVMSYHLQRRTMYKSSSLAKQLDARMASAVKNVANLMGDRKQQVKSDLLIRLKEHQKSNATDDEPYISDILAGMNVSKTKPASTSEMFTRSYQKIEKSIVKETNRHITSTIQTSIRERQSSSSVVIDNLLKNHDRLGIFNQMVASEPEEQVKTLFDVIEKEEILKQTTFPPRNIYEEMLIWTERDLLWQFPIDNEQNLGEEAEVGFHEHLFLDQHLGNFPTEGPIRHFMELVCIGLSQNPYVTALEKRDHIKWYEEYFKNKYHLIDMKQKIDTSDESSDTSKKETIP